MNSRLFLLKDFYSIDNVNDTRVAFSKLSNISVSEDEKYWICEFEDCKYGLEKTEKEFENYLIGLCNKEG